MVDNLITVENLSKHYFKKSASQKTLKAVDCVNFEIAKGKTLGLVGESGCGKTTISRLILNLIKPTSGTIYFRDKEIQAYEKENKSEFRQKMQIIFQDSYSALNPRIKIGNMLKEILKYHKICNPDDIKDRISELLDFVGLRKNDSEKYPHEFSGGQRQRICIARALSLNPEFIICDEPVSALDVSIQAQIINLLIDLQKKFNLTYLFITHDLSVVRYISDELIVMYKGKIVERGPTEVIFKNPRHQYTKQLLASAMKIKLEIAN
jgi:ABC-type oligopeptide transport system ATPase subunit